MAYENTAVAVSKSQEQIRKLILENGGSGIAFVSQPPMEGFEAMVVAVALGLFARMMWVILGG